MGNLCPCSLFKSKHLVTTAQETEMNQTHSHSTNNNKLVKIVLTGPPMSGKTQIMKAITNKESSTPQTDDIYKATIGVDYTKLTIGEHKVILFDTPGNYIYNTTVSNYYRGSDIIIIVSNPNNDTDELLYTEPLEDFEIRSLSVKEIEHNVETYADNNAFIVSVINTKNEKIQNIPIGSSNSIPQKCYIMDINDRNNVNQLFVSILKDYVILQSSHSK